MNATIGFGALEVAPYGAPRHQPRKKRRQPQQQQKKPKAAKPNEVRQRLFDMFAREYGTSKFPGWSDERTACIKRWRNDKADGECVNIVKQMKQLEQGRTTSRRGEGSQSSQPSR
jgi:hypothetical protein